MDSVQSLIEVFSPPDELLEIYIYYSKYLHVLTNIHFVRPTLELSANCTRQTSLLLKDCYCIDGKLDQSIKHWQEGRSISHFWIECCQSGYCSCKHRTRS
jgi:hypothetical protein